MSALRSPARHIAISVLSFVLLLCLLTPCSNASPIIHNYRFLRKKIRKETEQDRNSAKIGKLAGRLKEQIELQQWQQRFERRQEQTEENELGNRHLHRALSESMSEKTQRQALAQPTNANECSTPQCIGQSVLSAMDRTIDPCEDFYQYSCGSWLSKTPIPKDRNTVDQSFMRASDNVQLKLRALLEVDLQKPSHPNSIAGRFYSSCMQGYRTGPLNVRPLLPFVDDFASIKDSSSLASAIAAVHAVQPAAVFTAAVHVDIKEPNRHVFSLAQVGLESRNIGLRGATEPPRQQISRGYLLLIETLLRVAGHSGLIQSANYTKLAEGVVSFGQQLDAASLSAQELRNLNKTYNEVKLSDLPASLSIDTYLQAAKVNISALNDTVIVYDMNYFMAVGRMMDRIKTDILWRDSTKAYLAANLVFSFSSSGILGAAMFNLSYVVNRGSTGTTELPERWKSCERITSKYVGDAVGEAYVRKHFPEIRKTLVEKLSLDIGAVFRENLDNQEWMDVATQQAAKEKVDRISWKIGYPSKFKSYADLTIGASSFDANIVNALKYARRVKLDKLGVQVDKSEWISNAQTVGAFHNSLRNEITFPAGILQKPLFSQDFPTAMNYGSIGMIIGHEIVHGFDNQGRLFDKDGRLAPWWSPKSVRGFIDRAKCYVDLFNDYRVPEVNMKLNGVQTLNENIADANGVQVAFQAFVRSTGNADVKARAPNPVLAPVLTNHQLFYVAYAQTWCEKMRPEALRQFINSNIHSPRKFRVQGPLSQSEDFSRVFKCKSGSAYNPSKKCSMWWES